MESLKKQAARILREQKRYKVWLAAFLCLALVVTAGTVAALTMSGQALNRKEKVLTCKEEVHQHTDACGDSEGKLICGQADYVVHVHNDDCYGEDGELVCPLEERAPHVHDAACFQEQEVLICGQEESQGHQHGPECYTKVKGDLICGQDGAGHQHSPECYTKVKGDLICGQDGAGHQHGPECYTKVKGDLTCTSTEEGHEHTDECYAWSEDLTCGQTESAHEHTDECYAWSEELTCGQTEGAHEHTDECYAWSEELTCEIPDGEGAHTHTEECYVTESVNICGEPELHTHGEGCYDEGGNLICGQTELLEHVHGEGCFEIVEPDGEEELQGVAGVLTAQGSDYTVTATFGEDAGIPEGAQLIVSEVAPGTEEYETHYQQMLEAIGAADTGTSEEETDPAGEGAETEDGVEISFARLFDISFVVDGEKIEPMPGASVDIRISYQDAVECGEGETASAVHFAKDGTEVLEADVVESGEGSDFAFSQDSFSKTFSVITKAPNKKKTDTLTATVGDVFIAVTDENAASFDKSDSLEVRELKENDGEAESGNNRYRKYLNNSEGAIKNKVHQEGEEVEVYSARIFEISIVDGSGQKKNSNNNVKVEIRYPNGTKVEKSGSAVMVLNSEDNGLLLNSQTVAENQEIPVFSGVQMFSQSTPNVVTTMMVSAVELADTPDSGEGESASAHHDDVSGYLKSSAKNDWQIVAEGYQGNGVINKKESADGMVRVQKNVIPTDVENEFLVYLSIDMKSLFEKYFEMAEYKATTSNNYHSYKPGTVVPDMTGNKSADVTSDSAVAQAKGWTNYATFTMHGPDGNILVDNITLYWSQANNVTFYIDGHEANNQGVNQFVLVGVKVNVNEHHDITFTKDAMEYLERNLSKVVELGTVTDLMGESAETGKYITCLEILGGDYSKASISPDGKKLTWIPSAKPEPKIETTKTTDANGHEITTTWMLNVAELVYKVRLDVTEAGFNSCADNMDSTVSEPESYRVNAKATLEYNSGDTPASVDFPVPYVRGLLYDIAAKKVDKDDKNLKLQGAEFKLKQHVEVEGEDGTTSIVTDKVTVKGSDGNDLVWTSDKDGIIRFDDLPWGTYTLVETKAPTGYQPVPEGGREVGTVTVCRTTNAGDLTQDIHHKPVNMLYTGATSNPDSPDLKADGTAEKLMEDGYCKVRNEKLPIKLVKVWDDENNTNKLRPAKVVFKVEYALDVEGEKSWSPVTQFIQVVDGKETLVTKEKGLLEIVKPEGADRDKWEEIIGRPVINPTPTKPVIYRVTEVNPSDAEDGSYEKVLDRYEVKKEEGVQYSGDAVVTEESYIPAGASAEKKINAYTITNSLKPRKVKLVKVIQGTDTPLGGASFELYPKSKLATDYKADRAKAEEGGNIKTGDSLADGTFLELDLELGDYWLDEIVTPGGYTEPVVEGTDSEVPYVLEVRDTTILLKKGNVTISTGVKETNENKEEVTKVKVPNVPVEKNVRLLKTGGNGPLGGAEFEVRYEPDSALSGSKEPKTCTWYSREDDGVICELVFNKETEKDELVPIGKMDIGTWYIKETKAPDGYNLPKDEFIIEVDDEDGVSISKSMNNELNGLIVLTPPSENDETETYAIEIKNNEGIKLPETGGPGTVMYTLGGLAVIATSLVYGLSMRRKKEKGGRN